MTPTLTPRERELARHALGLPTPTRRRRRKGYASIKCTFDSINAEILRGMAERGLAAWQDSDHPWVTFRLTRSGALAALEPGEALDEEDFG